MRGAGTGNRALHSAWLMLAHYRRAMLLVVLCFLQSIVHGAYDEAFAIDTMLPLSSAAYGPNTRACLAVMQPHIEVASKEHSRLGRRSRGTKWGLPDTKI